MRVHDGALNDAINYAQKGYRSYVFDLLVDLNLYVWTISYYKFASKAQIYPILDNVDKAQSIVSLWNQHPIIFKVMAHKGHTDFLRRTVLTCDRTLIAFYRNLKACDRNK